MLVTQLAGSPNEVRSTSVFLVIDAVCPEADVAVRVFNCPLEYFAEIEIFVISFIPKMVSAWL